MSGKRLGIDIHIVAKDLPLLSLGSDGDVSAACGVRLSPPSAA